MWNFRLEVNFILLVFFLNTCKDSPFLPVFFCVCVFVMVMVVTRIKRKASSIWGIFLTTKLYFFSNYSVNPFYLNFQVIMLCLGNLLELIPWWFGCFLFITQADWFLNIGSLISYLISLLFWRVGFSLLLESLNFVFLLLFLWYWRWNPRCVFLCSLGPKHHIWFNHRD